MGGGRPGPHLGSEELVDKMCDLGTSRSPSSLRAKGSSQNFLETAESPVVSDGLFKHLRFSASSLVPSA